MYWSEVRVHGYELVNAKRVVGSALSFLQEEDH